MAAGGRGKRERRGEYSCVFPQGLKSRLARRLEGCWRAGEARAAPFERGSRHHTSKNTQTRITDAEREGITSSRSRWPRRGTTQRTERRKAGDTGRGARHPPLRRRIRPPRQGHSHPDPPLRAQSQSASRARLSPQATDPAAAHPGGHARRPPHIKSPANGARPRRSNPQRGESHPAPPSLYNWARLRQAHVEQRLLPHLQKRMPLGHVLPPHIVLGKPKHC